MEAKVAKKRRAKTKKIPEYFIYKMDEGKPIYYWGYKEHLDYYTRKTDALLDFGVEKVIWIFTDAKKS